MVAPVLFFLSAHRLKQKGETSVGSKGRVYSSASGIFLGVACAAVMCLLGLAGLTQMVMMERAGERGADVIVPVLLVLSSLFGCQIAAITASKKPMEAILLTSGSLIMTMIIAGLIMEGPFKDILLNMGAVAAGGAVSCVLCLKSHRKGAHRKKRYR